MPRSDWRRTMTLLRAVPLCSAVVYGLALAPAARAESVPASVRACTLETDSLKRLICFDKEVARYSSQPSSADATQVPPGGAAARDLRSQPTTPTVPPGPPREDRSDSVAPSAPPAAPKAPRHTAARIVSIDNIPDAIVVHLDNGQVWEQIQEASADMNLHAGDAVSIDREMGSFWLSGSSGAAVKVRQKK